MNSESEMENVSNGVLAARALDRSTLSEEAFHRMISTERRRTGRSRKSFLLMLLDMGDPSSPKQNKPTLRKIMSVLSLMLRETDVTGWYKEDTVVGVMFTEITLDEQNVIPATMMSRVTQTLKSHLPAAQFRQIGISYHLVSEGGAQATSASTTRSSTYPGPALPNSKPAGETFPVAGD